MPEDLFESPDIPEPQYKPEISGGQHKAETGQIPESIEKVLLDETRGCFPVFRGNNSSRAGSLAAAKAQVKVLQVEPDYVFLVDVCH